MREKSIRPDTATSQIFSPCDPMIEQPFGCLANISTHGTLLHLVKSVPKHSRGLREAGMHKTFNDLLAEFRRDVHGAIDLARARVGGARRMLELRLQVEGNDPELSPARWVHFAQLGTLDKLDLALRREGEYETFELLAIARNIFENLVWLRFLNRDYRNGLVFYSKLLKDEVQSIISYIQKVTDEAALFDSADQLDGDGLMSTIGEVLEEDPTGSVVAEAQHEHRRQAAMLDEMVRREFSLYGNAATFNGYGYQAHLLRTKALPEFEAQLASARHKQAILKDHLSNNYPSEISDRAESRWIWSDQARDAGMQKQYDFIYRLTSRLLHSTPLNIITEKILTEPECILVMDYNVVAAGDLLKEIEIFDYPEKMKAIAIQVD